MGAYPPRMLLASRTPTNQQIIQWDWDFHTVRGGIVQGEITVSVPELLDL